MGTEEFIFGENGVIPPYPPPCRKISSQKTKTRSHFPMTTAGDYEKLHQQWIRRFYSGMENDLKKLLLAKLLFLFVSID